jgi:hypothetical protein
MKTFKFNILLFIIAFSACSADFTQSEKFIKERKEMTAKIKWMTENVHRFESEDYSQAHKSIFDWASNQNYTNILLSYEFIPGFDPHEYEYSNHLLKEILKSQVEYFFEKPKNIDQKERAKFVLNDVIFLYETIKEKYPKEKSVTLEMILLMDETEKTALVEKINLSHYLQEKD